MKLSGPKSPDHHHIFPSAWIVLPSRCRPTTSPRRRHWCDWRCYGKEIRAHAQWRLWMVYDGWPFCQRTLQRNFWTTCVCSCLRCKQAPSYADAAGQEAVGKAELSVVTLRVSQPPFGLSLVRLLGCTWVHRSCMRLSIMQHMQPSPIPRWKVLLCKWQPPNPLDTCDFPHQIAGILFVVYAPVDPRDNNIILGLQPKKHPPEIIRVLQKSPRSHLQVIWRLPQNRGTGMYRGTPSYHPSQTNFDGDLRIHHDFGNFHQHHRLSTGAARARARRAVALLLRQRRRRGGLCQL